MADSIPKGLMSGFVYKFQRGMCTMSPITAKVSNICCKIWEAQRCVTSYWEEGQSDQEHVILGSFTTLQLFIVFVQL